MTLPRTWSWPRTIGVAGALIVAVNVFVFYIDVVLAGPSRMTILVFGVGALVPVLLAVGFAAGRDGLLVSAAAAVAGLVFAALAAAELPGSFGPPCSGPDLCPPQPDPWTLAWWPTSGYWMVLILLGGLALAAGGLGNVTTVVRDR